MGLDLKSYIESHPLWCGVSDYDSWWFFTKWFYKCIGYNVKIGSVRIDLLEIYKNSELKKLWEDYLVKIKKVTGNKDKEKEVMIEFENFLKNELCNKMFWHDGNVTEKDTTHDETATEEIEKYKEEIQELKKKEEDYKKEIENQKNEISKLNEENSVLKNRVSSLEKDREIQDAKIKNLEQNYDKVMKILDKLREENNCRRVTI